MSQPPYPQRPDQPVPPGWGPAPLQGDPRPGSPGYDPTRPLGPGRPATTSISEFAPPRSRAAWFIGIGVLLAAVLIAVTTVLPPGWPGPGAGSASPSPTPSATPTASGQPFTTVNGDVEGRWEVVERRWSDEGVQVMVRVAVDTGTLRFAFLAFSNDAAEVLYPAPGADQPDFGSDPITAGEQRDGWLFFPTYRADLTLILTTEVGRQISALVIKA